MLNKIKEYIVKMVKEWWIPVMIAISIVACTFMVIIIKDAYPKPHCTNCGSVVEESHLYCPRCGQHIDSTWTYSPYYPPEKTKKYDK